MTEFNAFPYGRQGLPSDIDLWIAREGGAEAIAESIIAECKQWSDGKARGPHRLSDSALSQLRTKIYLLVEFHRKEGKVPPRVVTDALAFVLGLVSPKTLEPVLSDHVLKEAHLPAVKKPEAFLEASQLDGEADAVGESISVSKLAGLVGVERATITKWRSMTEYADRRMFVAATAKR
jgi:hypothetical protein